MIIGMHKLARRSFLLGAAGMLPLAALAQSKMQGSHHLKTVGVQLYTVREILPKDPSGVLNQIQEIGYREVEAIYASLDAIWPSLEKTKLKPVSVHLDSNLFGDNGKMQSALENVKRRGFQYAVFPYLPENQRGGLDAIKKLADKLNSAGEQGKKLGLHICYHNHAFEYEPMNGTTPLAVLLENTHKDAVSLELDVFWASVAGHDPVQLLKKYSGRIALLHLKDKEKGLPVQYNEHVPADAFKAVGKGSLDFSSILRAAQAEGVKHYFVEQDHTPGNPIDSLRDSYNYVHGLSF
jgi:Sugar phosphate isomerases/epimerases